MMSQAQISPSLQVDQSGLSRPTPSSAERGVVIWAMVLGCVIRLAISVISLGTNDADIWRRIAERSTALGLINAFRTDQGMNHPILPVIWSQLAWALGGVPWFTFFMKLPAIAGDMAATWLLWKIWLRRGGARQAGWAAFAMALNPVAVIISGYHCNTDNLYAFLSLLCIYLITDRQRYFLGGLALAAAINVKLIPVLLIPAVYALCRNWREAWHLTAGLAIGVLPYLPLLVAPEAMMKNMVGYLPPESEWGFVLILRDLGRNSPFEASAAVMKHAYFYVGRWLILIGAMLLSVISWKTRRWNGYELATLTYILFLILAPGFGPQYTTIVIPLLLAISISRTWIYGILAGLFLAIAYGSRLVTPGLPLHTFFVPDSPTPPGTPFGLLAWGFLVLTGYWIVVRKRSPQSALIP